MKHKIKSNPKPVLTAASEQESKLRNDPTSGNTSASASSPLRYALSFGLNIAKIKEQYGKHHCYIYIEIHEFLRKHHFNWTDPTIYVGDGEIASEGIARAVLGRLLTAFPCLKTCSNNMKIWEVKSATNVDLASTDWDLSLPDSFPALQE